MTKREFKTNKLYYGFPIFLLGYQDEQWNYNFSTCSSSYSLGNGIVVGMGNGNALKQIKKYGAFTLNIPSKNAMKQIELGGFNSGKDKFHLPDSFHYTVSENNQAPILEECFCTLECRVETIQEFQGTYHIFANIERRLIEETLLEDEEHINYGQFDPVLYMGDATQRFYRYLDSDTLDKSGSFFKN
ncbi:flavin reductase family protein [Erwinia sp. CPCC 100877]|nr:flavin reductase family protein [Erwinia sp. CPCC 100877]